MFTAKTALRYRESLDIGWDFPYIVGVLTIYIVFILKINRPTVGVLKIK
jgi:hypothetical protein